jgi:hypothetical protein
MTADRTIVDGQTDSGQWTFFSFASWLGCVDEPRGAAGRTRRRRQYGRARDKVSAYAVVGAAVATVRQTHDTPVDGSVAALRPGQGRSGGQTAPLLRAS